MISIRLLRFPQFLHPVSIFFLFLALAQGAPRRLNRAADSAAPVTEDNPISSTQDADGNLHLVYTDSDLKGHWQVYYRSLKEDYLGIPVNLSGVAAGGTSAHSPQIVFDFFSGNLYASWLSHPGPKTDYRLEVARIQPKDGAHNLLKDFDFGTANFPPKVVASPGKIFFLSQERPPKGRDYFRVRVLFTDSGDWLEKRLESTATEIISYPTIAASNIQASLFWVRSTSQGHDVMAASMPAEEKEWSEAKQIFRSPALPEFSSAAAHEKLVSLAWTLRGGAGNSILLQMVSRDGGQNWKPPGVFYSIGASAAAAMSVLDDKEIVALFYVSDKSGDKIKMKYSVNAGESWIPDREVDAIDIAPGKDAREARRPSLATRSDNRMILVWEERKTYDFALMFKVSAPQDFKALPFRTLSTESGANRYSYFPQVWVAGEKAFVTYGNKRRPSTVTENINTSDLYITELPALFQRPSKVPAMRRKRTKL